MRENTTVVEIVESRGTVEGTGGFIKPDTVRINGHKLWVPRGEAIEVHGVTLNGPEGAGDDVVSVTLTLWARRVYIGHDDENPEREPEAQP